MIANFLGQEIDDFDLEYMWLQQNDANYRTICDNMNLLREKCSDRAICRNTDVRLLPRSCEIIPLDVFLWRRVNSFAYSSKPQTFNDLIFQDYACDC